jgi:hypothetical protein
MGLGAALIESLNFVFERWDVREPPAWRAVSAPLIARIMHLANELEVHARVHGAEAAMAMADYRAGGAFDPHLVWLFCQASGRVLEVLEARSPREAAMAADLGKRQLREAGMDRGCRRDGLLHRPQVRLHPRV